MPNARILGISTGLAIPELSVLAEEFFEWEFAFTRPTKLDFPVRFGAATHQNASLFRYPVLFRSAILRQAIQSSHKCRPGSSIILPQSAHRVVMDESKDMSNSPGFCDFLVHFLASFPCSCPADRLICDLAESILTKRADQEFWKLSMSGHLNHTSGPGRSDSSLTLHINLRPFWGGGLCALWSGSSSPVIPKVQSLRVRP